MWDLRIFHSFGCVMAYKDLAKRRECVRRWNQSHPSVVAAAVERYRAKIKNAVISAYGGQCRLCGCTDNLELHHIHHDGAKHRDEVGQSIHIYRWAFKHGFPQDRLELLCRDCHRTQHPMERNDSGQFTRPMKVGSHVKPA